MTIRWHLCNRMSNVMSHRFAWYQVSQWVTCDTVGTWLRLFHRDTRCDTRHSDATGKCNMTWHMIFTALLCDTDVTQYNEKTKHSCVQLSCVTSHCCASRHIVTSYHTVLDSWFLMISSATRVPEKKGQYCPFLLCVWQGNLGGKGIFDIHGTAHAGTEPATTSAWSEHSTTLLSKQ